MRTLIFTAVAFIAAGCAHEPTAARSEGKVAFNSLASVIEAAPILRSKI